MSVTQWCDIMARLFLCLLFLAAPAFGGNHEKYEGHQLYRVAGTSEEISSLQANLDIISAKPASRTSSGKLEALVRLAPEEKEQWLQYFVTKDMSYTKVADNLASILRDQDSNIKASRANAKRNGRSITWNTYYTHEEINNYLDELGQEYGQNVTVINAALTEEGRQIKYVRISTTRFENLLKPVIIIDAGVHAREWITPPVALYIIHQLVVARVDEALLERLDWVIIPLANPDGYTYSWEEDRLWRKTRSQNHPGGFFCPGVDVNRNFDHYFGTVQNTGNPCTIVYEGPSAFSEPETRVIRDAVLQNINRASLYISLHSYGGMFLYAWGNNGTLPTNGLALHLAGIAMANAIHDAAPEGANPYVVGNAAQVLYYTTGTSRDWTRAAGVPLTYTLEIEDYGYYFVVPAEYIEQIVKELWAGISQGGHYVLSLYS